MNKTAVYILLTVCLCVFSFLVSRNIGNPDDAKRCEQDKASLQRKIDLCYVCAPQCKPPPISDGEDE